MGRRKHIKRAAKQMRRARRHLDEAWMRSDHHEMYRIVEVMDALHVALRMAEREVE